MARDFWDVRDWRGRFAKLPSRRPRKPNLLNTKTTRAQRKALTTKITHDRENMAASLYRKRTVAQVSSSEKADLFGTPTAPKYAPLDYVKSVRGSRFAMMRIDQMDPADRKRLERKPIWSAEDADEAVLIMRLRHGERVAFEGWQEPGLSLIALKESLYAADDMLTKYPDVDISFIDAASPEKFKSNLTLAHCMKSIGHVGIEVNNYHLKRDPEEYRGFSDEQWSEFKAHPPVGFYGAFGDTLVHEFGHAVDYHAYHGQWTRKYPAFNMGPRGDQDPDRFPTLAQGRNGAVRQALVRAFNREHGIKPETKPVGPKSNLWEDYVKWLQDNVSTYSVNDNAQMYMNAGGQKVRYVTDEQGKLNFNYSELIAEAFADVESNGDRAWPTSKAIHEVLVWQYKQNNGGLKARYQK